MRTKIMLSANRALLGAITPSVRAITVDYNKEVLTLKTYFDQGATDDDRELINIALSEMAADLWQDIERFIFEPVDLPYPAKMDMLKEWIFMRHENTENLNAE